MDFRLASGDAKQIHGDRKQGRGGHHPRAGSTLCASSCVPAQHHVPRAKLNTDRARHLGGCLLLLTCSQPCYSSHSCAETY